MSERDNKYGKTLIGDSGVHRNPEPKPGFTIWIESGNWYTAPVLDTEKFGPHDYDNGGYERGIRECRCGCHMGGSSSSGPCDPFGNCPENPKAALTQPNPDELKACPFCQAKPIKFSNPECGYEVPHTDDCFINALPHIQGKRAIKEWQARTPDLTTLKQKVGVILYAMEAANKSPQVSKNHTLDEALAIAREIGT